MFRLEQVELQRVAITRSFQSDEQRLLAEKEAKVTAAVAHAEKSLEAQLRALAQQHEHTLHALDRERSQREAWIQGALQLSHVVADDTAFVQQLHRRRAQLPLVKPLPVPNTKSKSGNVGKSSVCAIM
jgi:hypothetical protein